MRVLTSLLGALILMASLGSCSLQAKLTLAADGSAQIDAAFQWPAPTRSAWANLRTLDPTLPEDPFAPTVLRAGLGEEARIRPTPGGTQVTFTVADPKRLFPGLKTDSGSWDLTLDRKTVRALAALTSWSGSPAVDSLIPSPDTTVTESDYRDLLVYLLGPETPEAAARALIDRSVVQLTLVAPRPIVTAEGSVSVVDRTAVYRWPLVRVLTLETPLRLRLTF